MPVINDRAAYPFRTIGAEGAGLGVDPGRRLAGPQLAAQRVAEIAVKFVKLAVYAVGGQLLDNIAASLLGRRLAGQTMQSAEAAEQPLHFRQPDPVQ